MFPPQNTSQTLISAETFQRHPPPPINRIMIYLLLRLNSTSYSEQNQLYNCNIIFRPFYWYLSEIHCEDEEIGQNFWQARIEPSPQPDFIETDGSMAINSGGTS